MKLSFKTNIGGLLLLGMIAVACGDKNAPPADAQATNPQKAADPVNPAASAMLQVTDSEFGSVQEMGADKTLEGVKNMHKMFERVRALKMLSDKEVALLDMSVLEDLKDDLGAWYHAKRPFKYETRGYLYKITESIPELDGVREFREADERYHNLVRETARVQASVKGLDMKKLKLEQEQLQKKIAALEAKKPMDAVAVRKALERSVEIQQSMDAVAKAKAKNFEQKLSTAQKARRDALLALSKNTNDTILKTIVNASKQYCDAKNDGELLEMARDILVNQAALLASVLAAHSRDDSSHWKTIYAVWINATGGIEIVNADQHSIRLSRDTGRDSVPLKIEVLGADRKVLETLQ